MPRKPNASKPEATLSNLTGRQPDMSVYACKKKKQSKNRMIVVRRSSRLLSVVGPSPATVKGIVQEPIHLSESEDEEDEHALPDKFVESPAPTDLEEDMNQMDHETVDEQFKSKATKGAYPDENMNADFSYKSLYIDSLKKVEALKEENTELAKRLEFSLGKIEAYETFKDTVMHIKDTVLVSSIGRATEAAINMASQGTIGNSSLSGTPNNNVTKQSGAHAKKKK